MFCCYIVQAQICEDKGESCNACIKANCHFLANKDNTTICLTTQIFNALNFNNNRHLRESNMTEKTKADCDDLNDNTNDKKQNGSNSSVEGVHDPSMDNHEKQNSTIKPPIEISTMLNTDNDSNDTVNVNATTAKINKETITKPTDNKNESSTTERTKTPNKGGFSAGSFIGGIVLVICASLVTFYGVRYYKTYRDGRPFSFRIFNNNHGFAARQDSDDPGFPF